MASVRTAEGYLVGEPCGPPPQNMETETALQAVTRSVSQCKTLKQQNQVAFFWFIQHLKKETIMNPFLRLWRLFLDDKSIGILSVLLVLLLVAFVVVMFWEKATIAISGLLGITDNNKYEVLKFLGIGMGGILISLQALMSYKRAKAMEDTVKYTEQGQRQERMKNAIEHLGHDSDSVRLGGSYELFHLAKDTEVKDLRQTVFDILCAYIRQTTTGENEYRNTHRSKPSEEIQSLLTLLFVQGHGVFKGLRINLQGSWLNGAILRKAHLEKAILTGAHLEGATLTETNLQEGNLDGANLQNATLRGANLQKATFQRANLQEANFDGANVQEANFDEKKLQGQPLTDS